MQRTGTNTDPNTNTDTYSDPNTNADTYSDADSYAAALGSWGVLWAVRKLPEPAVRRVRRGTELKSQPTDEQRGVRS